MKELLTIQEAATILQSCGIDCHWHDVKKWAVEGKIKATHENKVYKINQNDVYEFIELLWKDTSNEIEINDETKITRLIQEIKQLEKENKKLRRMLSLLE